MLPLYFGNNSRLCYFTSRLCSDALPESLNKLPFIEGVASSAYHASIRARSNTCDSYRFSSDLMDVVSMAGVHQQSEQPKYLAEDQTLL